MNEAQFNAIPKTQRFNQVLEGTAFYANVQTPNTSAIAKFGGPAVYQVFLGLSETEAIKAEAMLLKILPPTETIPMPHVKLIRKLSKKEIEEGKKITDVKPLVLDSKQKVVPDTLLVGNGSKVVCKFGTYWYPNQGGGVATMLSKVQIRDLVPYVRKGDKSLAMDDEGFSIETDNLADVLSTPVQTSEKPVFDDKKGDPLPWGDTPKASDKKSNKVFDE